MTRPLCTSPPQQLSVPASRVPCMHSSSSDRVDPADAALQALLAGIADCTPDGEKRDTIIDYMLTIPELKDWTPDSLARLQDTCNFVVSLSRQLREQGP